MASCPMIFSLDRNETVKAIRTSIVIEWIKPIGDAEKIMHG